MALTIVSQIFPREMIPAVLPLIEDKLQHSKYVFISRISSGLVWLNNLIFLVVLVNWCFFSELVFITFRNCSSPRFILGFLSHLFTVLTEYWISIFFITNFDR